LNTLKRLKTSTRHTAIAGALASAVLLLSAGAQAQTIYRIVGADGSVTFSDKQPAANDNVTTLGSGGRPLAAGNSTLPAELRQVAGKFPVTLYTSSNCTPCGQGRELLSNRGIPFTEKTVSTAEDMAALQRISGDNSMPLLSVGSQQLKGFSDLEWSQYLDAAGYPKSTTLPAGYRNPAATPLVIVQQAAPAKRADENPVAAPIAPVGNSPSNPAGIKF
jgi:glutaredoxin